MSKFFFSSSRMTRVIVSLSTVIALSGAGVVLPQVASAITIAELQAQIALLTAQLNTLIGSSVPAGKCAFTRSLTIGVTGDDVKCLQQYLNGAGFQVSASGAGSPGSETTTFGPRTQAAVAKWQAANGVAPAAGYFGSISRAKYDSMVAGGPTPPAPPGTPPAAGTGLTVAAATQPGDSLAPLNAARLPATKFTLTASSDGDIKVNSITVERQGPSADASVSSLVLLDEDGLQVGLSKTLNSNHQAILNEAQTVKAGTSRTFTIGVNRPASGTDGGDVVKIAVVAIDAGSAKVNGTLPIVGSPMTMNHTLTIGAATVAKGVNDPGSSQTKEIGTKGYIFTALRVTAGSNEDLSMKWVSFNQSGSAAASDLKNIKVVLDGTEYDAKVSADGKYYTANFGSGVDLTKGNTKEFYVKGDVESGSNRGIDFDLYRFTDIYVVGKQYGYGITPTATDSADSSTDDDGTLQATNPVWDAYEATIGSGTINVSKSIAVPAQNIAVNLENQPLGAFDVEVKGEPVTVASMIFRISRASSGAGPDGTLIDQVKLIDNTTGQVVAGPKDNGAGTITFTDSVTFPVGKRAYVLKGKLTTDWASDQTIAASTTPSSGWTSIVGSSSGTSITAAPTAALTANTMTVKAGAVSVSVASTPTAQTVIRGATGFTFANINFDATASGEDIRFTTARLQYNAAVAGDLTNCQLFDGTAALNTGTNVKNPSSAGEVTFTLDNNLNAPKGTSKTVAVKCDANASGTGDYVQWTLAGDEFGASAVQATGLTSGSTINPTVASSSVANKMTMSASGSLAIAIDASSPSVRLAQAGEEVILAAIRFTSTNEAVDVKQINLKLSNVASNTPTDIGKLTLWDGATKLGEVTATSSDEGLTVTVSGLVVPKDADKTVTVKGQLSAIGTNQAGRPGHLLTVDYAPTSLNGNRTTYGVGQQSSSNIYVTSDATASAGVRIVRGYPTVSVLSLPSTSLADATQKALYRFSVSAPAATNGVALYKFTFNVATSGDDGIPDFTIKNLRLYAFTSSGFTGGKYTADGQLNNGGLFSADSVTSIEADQATTSDYAIYFNPAAPTSSAAEAVTVSAGETVYFELRGDVVGADSGDSATIQLMGDSAWFPAVCNGGLGLTCDDTGFLNGGSANNSYGYATSAHLVDEAVIGSSGGTAVATGLGHSDATGSGDDFIWSGNSTTTHSGAAGINGPDWSNGFVVPGLPSAGATAVTLTL